jgi:plastocyanin domain-containing protein
LAQLFFATPHTGLDTGMFRKLIMANKHARVKFSKNPPIPLLNEMDKNHNSINDLLKRFRRVTAGIKFVTLLEGAFLPGMKEVVGLIIVFTATAVGT